MPCIVRDHLSGAWARALSAVPAWRVDHTKHQARRAGLRSFWWSPSESCCVRLYGRRPIEAGADCEAGADLRNGSEVWAWTAKGLRGTYTYIPCGMLTNRE